MSTYRYARESLTPNQKEQRKVEALKSDIANAERVLAWQQEEGYAEQMKMREIQNATDASGALTRGATT